MRDLSLLRRKAAELRLDIVKMIHLAASGHPGGSLSIAELLTALYHDELRHDPRAPKDPARDRFVLSKGHTAPALYAVLAQCGYFDREELWKLRQVGAMLQGHPDRKGTPGVDMSTGSLGLGISAACGMAKAAKMAGDNYRVYTILGDGEIEEGQVWEALMFAAHYKLDNLVVIIDANGLQIDGRVKDVMNVEPIADKLAAFGFAVSAVDGHDFEEIFSAFDLAKMTKDRPTAIIAKTVKGKGVSFMEDNASWHGSAPNAVQYEQARQELEAVLAAIDAEIDAETEGK
ncbi:MAG: transketolase [Clostridia bacterium]|nr:transketolase [Clostridia bacterium]